MAIEGLFDHQVRVWRATEVEGIAGEIEEVWGVVSSGPHKNCAIVPPRTSTEDIGPGDTSRGVVQVFLGVWVDVQDRDVIEVVAGPMAPRTYLAEGTNNVRGHHIEVSVTPIVVDLED